jgi:hypothetical protein
MFFSAWLGCTTASYCPSNGAREYDQASVRDRSGKQSIFALARAEVPTINQLRYRPVAVSLLRVGFDPEVYEQIRALKIDPLVAAQNGPRMSSANSFSQTSQWFNAEYEVRRSLAVTMPAAPFAS